MTAVSMMNAVVITGNRQTQTIQLPVPQPEADQILIRIKGCAICTWEQRVFQNLVPAKLPFLGGHEVAGEIVALGSDVDPQEFPIGSHATVRLLVRCGRCTACRTGEDNICDAMQRPPYHKKTEISGPGGMVEYMAVNADQVYLLDTDVPFERIVFAEPLGCVVNSIQKAKICLGDDVVVLGAGIMGLLHVLCLKNRGTRVVVSEPNEERAKMAKRLGADLVIDPTKTDPVQEVKKFTGNVGAQAVFNTITPKFAVSQGINMLAKGGYFVMYGIVFPNVPVETDFNQIHNNEIHIVGCMSPSVESFHRSVNLLNKGILRPEELGLLSASYDFQHAEDAFCASISPETYRVMITF